MKGEDGDVRGFSLGKTLFEGEDFFDNSLVAPCSFFFFFFSSSAKEEGKGSGNRGQQRVILAYSQTKE